MTLTEVVIALGILSFVFIPMLGLLSIAQTSTRQSMETSTANLMAQAIEEEFARRPWSGASSLVHFYFDDEGARVGESSSRRLYSVEVEPGTAMVNGTNSFSANLVNLKIRIKSPGMAEHALIFSSLISNRGQ